MTAADRYQLRWRVPKREICCSSDETNWRRQHHNHVVDRGLARFCWLRALLRVEGGARFFAKALALECAGMGDNIRVNSIHPGVIDTPLWDTILLGKEGQERRRIDAHRMGHTDAPIGRAGTADEVASCVVFLVSDASSYMTGAELVPDGGNYHRRHASP